MRFTQTLQLLGSGVAGDLLLCAKEPWERAFDMEHCLKGWRKIGVSPFTRCAVSYTHLTLPTIYSV